MKYIPIISTLAIIHGESAKRLVACNLKLWQEAHFRAIPPSNVFTISQDHHNSKLSKYLTEMGFGTRSQSEKVCDKGLILINNVPANGGKILHYQDTIQIIASSPSANIISSSRTTRILRLLDRLENINNYNPPLQILFEDDHMAIINKPAGIHSLQWKGTYEQKTIALDEVLPFLLYPPPNDSMPRPLPMHRLDSRVSGCLVIAKSRSAAVTIGQQFENHQIGKIYTAILQGELRMDCQDLYGRDSIQILPLDTTSTTTNNNVVNSPQTSENPSSVSSSTTVTTTTTTTTSSVDNKRTNQILITAPLGGRHAESTIQILQTTPSAVGNALTTVEVRPRTGRRHQIRQHCAILGHAIIGDDLYHTVASKYILQDRLTILEKMNSMDNSNSDNDADNIDVDVDGSTIAADMIEVEEYTRNVNTFISVPSKQPDIDTRPTVSPLPPLPPLSPLPPPVRKGIGLYLSCTGVSLTHPITGQSICINVPEPSKFEKLREKALKGWEWQNDVEK
eukprot:gene8044-16491_t